MDCTKLIIRPMKENEQKEVVQVGRKAFSFFEALFVVTPKQAVVAEYENKIIGSIIYKYMNAEHKTIVYIDEAFIDPQFHNQGVGKRLYTETFNFLWSQGCDYMSALVKDDNVGSWKLLIDNGFQRVSIREVLKNLGVVGTLKQGIATPWLFAVGMDFYLINKEKNIQAKGNPSMQALVFLLVNLLLITPAWIFEYIDQPEKIVNSLLVYFTILCLFIGSRYVGVLLNKENWHFRFNNGGGFVTVLLSFFGNTFPMNANWYPEKYEKTNDFRRKMAQPELIKWALFSGLPFLAFTNNHYLMAIAQIACYYLLFMMIPVYPFESFGAGRVYRYNKLLWLATFFVSAIELYFVFNLT